MTDTASGDTALTQQTLDELATIADRYPHKRSGLLPMLHLVQSAQGRITPEGIRACADATGITPAEVSGVATFYTMYKRRQVGDFHVGICINTLCAVLGGDEIWDAVTSHLRIGPDETTPRRPGDAATVSIERIECNAACDYAPVATVNWEFMDNQTPESVLEMIDDLRAGREVTSTRGPRIVTWREAERVIAGFDDVLADEGPSAGPASLRGREIAHAQGWRAPAPAPEAADEAGEQA